MRNPVDNSDEAWVQDRVRVLADIDPPPSRFGSASVLRRGERARRRRLLLRSAGGAVLAVAACSAVLTVTSVHGGTTAPSALPAVGAVPAPEVLTVTCTPTGTQVDRSLVEAAPDGVHMRLVDVSGRRGTYVNFRLLGPGDETREGDEGTMFVNGPDEVLSEPPGRMSLRCGSEEAPLILDDPKLAPKETGPVVEVVDPHGWYNPRTPDEAGCYSPAVGAVTWGPKGPRWGAGETPGAAVDSLLRNMGGIKIVRRAEVLPYGYVNADKRVAIVYEWGRPAILATVWRSGDTWKAAEEAPCEPKG